ncbi:hypothetical protein B1810_14310 [Panacagrimonas perspica]|nr:hypothetical protein B1810_14310 [Panacagrimonas perspica]
MCFGQDSNRMMRLADFSNGTPTVPQALKENEVSVSHAAARANEELSWTRLAEHHLLLCGIVQTPTAKSSMPCA